MKRLNLNNEVKYKILLYQTLSILLEMMQAMMMPAIDCFPIKKSLQEF